MAEETARPPAPDAIVLVHGPWMTPRRWEGIMDASLSPRSSWATPSVGCSR
jgi:hypothetical protein